MIGLLGSIILCYSIFTIGVMILVHIDFFNRTFKSDKEKEKWRNVIFRSVWGKFNYFFNVVINKNRFT